MKLVEGCFCFGTIRKGKSVKMVMFPNDSSFTMANTLPNPQAKDELHAHNLEALNTLLNHPIAIVTFTSRQSLYLHNSHPNSYPHGSEQEAGPHPSRIEQLLTCSEAAAVDLNDLGFCYYRYITCLQSSECLF